MSAIIVVDLLQDMEIVSFPFFSDDVPLIDAIVVCNVIEFLILSFLKSFDTDAGFNFSLAHSYYASRYPHTGLTFGRH